MVLMLMTSHFAVKKFYSVSAYRPGPQRIWSAAPGPARNRAPPTWAAASQLSAEGVEKRPAPVCLGFPNFRRSFRVRNRPLFCGSTPQRAQCPGRLGNVAFAAVLENGQECRPGFAPRARATLTRVENHQSSNSRARPTSARLGRLDLPPDLCPTVPAPTSIGINHERVARK